jgi:hypothetical protein
MSASLIAPPEPALARREASGPLSVVACPHLFTVRDRVIREIPAGLTLAEILLECGIPPDRYARAWVDDREVPRAWWPHVRPKPGHRVTIRVVPLGGGQSGKQVGRIVGLIVVAIVAAAVSYGVGGAIVAAGGSPLLGAVVGGVAGAAVAGAGGLLVNALIPIQTPRMDALRDPAGTTSSPTYSLQGARNTMAIGRKVPKVYGLHRMTPPYAAEPIVETIGTDQYLTLVFSLGIGRVAYLRPRIGDEPLENFQGVETEFREGSLSDPALTLYLGDAHMEPLSLPLSSTQGAHIRTTQVGTRRIVVDYLFPRGVGRFDRQTGDLGPYEAGVNVILAIRLQGTPTWIQITDVWHLGPTRDAIRGTLVAEVAEGTYEVTVYRQAPESTEDAVLDEVFWTGMTSRKWTPIINLPGEALFALRIKANEQLQGIVDTFNVEVVSILPAWTGAAWVETTTNNPAAIYRDILQGRATRRPVADARINLEALQDWSEFCDQKGYGFSAVIDYETTVGQLLADVAAVGLATPTLDSQGRHSIVRDVAQAAPVQLFTPRNSWGFRGRKAFPDRPHGYRVRFVDGDPNALTSTTAPPTWEIDEQVVYAEGYGSANATLFESLEFRGVTWWGHAWALARYHERVVALRPEVWELSADVENLVCTRGDRVRLAHDVLSVGLGWGRVKSWILSGGGPQVIGFVSDEELSTETTKSYSVVLRGTGTPQQVVWPIVSTGTTTTTVTFTTPRTVGEAGGLFAWGETGAETMDALVKSIEPGEDLTARLTLVPYHEAIYAYDTSEPLPPYMPTITRGRRLPWRRPGPPAPPIIDAVQADETVMRFGPAGEPRLRLVASVRYIPQPGAPDQAPEFVVLERQYRIVGPPFSREAPGPWVLLGGTPAIYSYVEFPELDLQAGQTYDIRIRSIAGRQASAWVEWRDITPTGRTTRPPDVPVFMVDGRVIRWAYPDPPVDFAGFRLRRHISTRTIWEDAQPLHDGRLSSTVESYAIDHYDTDVTYLLKAVNTSGLESQGAAVVTVNLPSGIVFGDRLVPNILEVRDYQADSYPGTVVNGALDGGSLKAAATPTVLFWSEGDPALFWSGDDGALFWDGASYLAMQYLFSALPDADQVPSTLVIDGDVTGAHAVDYRPGGMALFWSSDGADFWDDDAALFWTPGALGWIPWPGSLDLLTRQVVEFRITTAAGPVRGIIGDLAVTIDVPDIREHFEDFAIGSSGSRLPITRTYRAVKIVNATLQADGGSAVRVRIDDKGTGGPPLTDGPLLSAFNAAGSGVTATADVEIIGY